MVSFMARRWKRLLLAGCIAVMALAAFVLYRFNPERVPFYPVCVFHRVTGLNCPGCGGLRAMHQLLNGKLAAAWRLNALAVLLVPMLLAGAIRAAWLYPRGRIDEWLRPGWLWFFLAGAMIFGVARNL